MKYLLLLAIPPIWWWGITLSLLVRDYFDQEIYQGFSSFIVCATLLFPAIAFCATMVILLTVFPNFLKAYR